MSMLVPFGEVDKPEVSVLAIGPPVVLAVMSAPCTFAMWLPWRSAVAGSQELLVQVIFGAICFHIRNDPHSGKRRINSTSNMFSASAESGSVSIPIMLPITSVK
jgi:hypothetical protein